MDKAVPEIRILNYEEAVSFYCDKLGFEIVFEWRHEPGFPVYMGLRRGDLYIHLSEHKGNGEPGNGRGMLLLVKEIDSYFNELKQKGIKFEQELRLEPWGDKAFVLNDPFGNRIGVNQRTESSQLKRGENT